MKVIIDTNVWISILLSPAPFTTNWQIYDAFLNRQMDVVVPPEMFDEIRGSTANSKWLREHIAPDAVETLISLLNEFGMITSSSDYTEEEILRDSKDDYLIRAARRHSIDILVSGDDDVLAHAGNEPFAILAPSAFVAALSLLADS